MAEGDVEDELEINAALNSIDSKSEVGDYSHPKCPVCQRSMPVNRSGLVRVHGPVANRCPGSRQPFADAPSWLGGLTTNTDRSCLNMPEQAFNFHRRSVRILKRIPRASRELSAGKLAVIFERVISDNAESSWNRLFSFPASCLRAPDRGGHRSSLASHTNQLIQKEADPSLPGRLLSICLVKPNETFWNPWQLEFY